MSKKVQVCRVCVKTANDTKDQFTVVHMITYKTHHEHIPYMWWKYWRYVNEYYEYL